MATIETRLRETAAGDAAAPLHRREQTWDGLALALLFVALILVLLTFKDYGVTWDEDVHRWYGGFVLDYYLSGFTDLRSLHWLDLFNYGGAFDATVAALNKISPFGVYETRHLFNAIVGLVGIVGTWKLARTLAGPRAGFIAALFLLLTPNYYGQMFNNPKDIPFAAGAVWTIYYIARLLPALPRPPFSLVVRLGIACGLTLGVRVGGLLFLAYLGMMLGLFGIWRAFETQRLAVGLRDGAVSLACVFLPAALIAYSIMLIFWPWAQIAPISHPLAALATFSHETFTFRTLFAGDYVPATDLPWVYLPVYILIALPELILVLFLTSPVTAWRALRHRETKLERSAILGRFLVGFAIVFPVAYAIAIRAVLFDGMRHFMFVLPPIAVVAALIGDRALDWLAAQRWRRAAYAVLALYGLAHITIMAKLHPDEYVYYNAFVGGTRGAQGLFKLDYWANSYAEAVHGLRDRLKAQYGADFRDHDFTVAVCGPPGSAAYYFPPNFIYTADAKSADFFIAFTKDGCDKSLPGKEIYRVERMDTVLSVVLDRRAIIAGEHPAVLAGGR
jgi:Dolichyl-phosphate-mannose-protein mannosyltransferase